MTPLNWNSATVREVTTIADPALPAIADIYERSFPPEERDPVSFLLRFCVGKELGEETESTLLTLDQPAPDGQPDARCAAALAFIERGEPVPELGSATVLWYLAVDAELRGQKLGERQLQSACSHAFADPGCLIVPFEIEQEADARDRHGDTAAQLAVRRKAWYRRQGAFELTGIFYESAIAGYPPLPYDVMFIPRPGLELHLTRADACDETSVATSLNSEGCLTLSAEDVFKLCASALDSSLAVAGDLRIV